jgi:hypothetical protein
LGAFIFKEENMERVNGTPIYWLGAALGGFQANLVPNMTASMATHLGFARGQVEFFVNQVQALPLSKDAAIAILLNIDICFSAERLQNPNTIIPKAELDVLSAAIYNFQAVLNTELPRANIFYITPKRAYDMTMLINQGESILSQQTINALGDYKDAILNDVKEATKCFAFDISTSVGFHIYRVIEAIVVRGYFPALEIEKTDWGKNRNLGHYITILEKAGVDKKITAMLRHLKDHYRNPISHPEEFLDSNTAESAFMLAISVITVMVQDIENRRIMGTTP